MAKKLVSYDDQKPGLGLPDAVENTLSAHVTDPATTHGRQIQQAHLAPSLTPIYARHEPLRQVVIQTADPKVAYAARFDGSPGRPFDKTTDGGQTWTQRGSLPFAIIGATRLSSGTIIAVEDTSRTVAGDSRLARSTDDGATWSVITGILRFPPLSEQGICEGTDGSIGIAEYGNVAGAKYRIRRSTDDGLTWTTVLESSGTEPQHDPGHFHSLTYDPIEKCHVAFLDRPDFGGFDGPQIWISRDDMATWTLLGSAVDWDHPNFVAPMYFKNYIAWGSDNQINGRISRMKREHFYSGNWADNTEHVFQSNQQAMYWSMPVRDDVWLVFTNIEHIRGEQDGRMGYACSVLVVDQDGARVSGGIDYTPMVANFTVGQYAATRFRAPSLPMGHTESQGWAWLYAPGAGTIPITQGWAAAAHTPRLDSEVVVRKGRGVKVRKPSGGEFTPMRANEDNMELGVGTSETRAGIRLVENGSVELFSNGQVVSRLASGTPYMIFPSRIGFGSTTVAEALGIQFGSTPPEGSVSARGGSLYMCYDTTTPSNQGLWVKTNPEARSAISQTGWVKVGHGAGDTAGRPAAPAAGVSFFDQTLGKPIWWSGTAWVDATGTAV